MKSERITLVMVCDNHLVVMLSALLKSIELSCSSEELLDIYIIEDGISPLNINKINRTITSTNIRIIWKAVADVIPPQFHLPVDKSTYPMCIYMRLFLPYFLPENLTKAIYLDVDMIVLKDIQLLWKIDMGDYPVAAVLDMAKVVSNSWSGIKNYRELNICGDAKYFNSGLLIVNLQKWRDLNATQHILTIIEENKEFALYPDQYGLNVFFANRWYEVDPRWNNYSDRLNADPFIIHFTQIKPIYIRYNFNQEYRKIFYAILRLTPWKGFAPNNAFKDHTKKVCNLVSKGEWFVLFSKLFNISFTKHFIIRNNNSR